MVQDSTPSQTSQIWIFTRDTDFASNRYRDWRILYFLRILWTTEVFPSHIFKLFVLRYIMYEGVCAGSSTSTAHKCFYTFASVLHCFKPYIVHMPTREMMEENAREVWNKHHIHNVIGGIDGSHVRMECLTRQMPDGMDKEIFRNRKGWSSLNSCVWNSKVICILTFVVC